MLNEGLVIHSADTVKAALELSGGIYRYCSFEQASIEGGCFDGVFISCSFKRIELYWGLFNLAVVVNCTFEDCSFLGTSFAACQFVECKFINCRFAVDNLGGSCNANDSRFFACLATNCKGWDELLVTSIGPCVD